MGAPTIVRFVGRPSNIGRSIERFMVNIAEDIMDQQISQRMVATGASLKSHILTIKKQPDEGEYEAVGYYTFLVKDQGREPGTYPPTNAIQKWIRDRSISVPIGMTLRQLAFLISRKIKNRGTEITEGKKGIDIHSAIERYNDEFANDVGDTIAHETAEAMLQAFKRIPNVKIR